MTSSERVAELLRSRLRSPEHPELAVGSKISLTAIQRNLGVSRNTALRALDTLAREGHLRVRPRQPSEVLPAPTALPTQEIDRLLSELNSAVLREQGLLARRDHLVVLRTLRFLAGHEMPAYRVGLVERWDGTGACPMCRKDPCTPDCPLSTLRRDR